MNSKYKYLIKNTGILAISNFSSKLLVFFLVPIYTSVLSTAEYGTYDLAMSTVLLLYPVLTVNIVDGVMRFSMEKGRIIQNNINCTEIYICRDVYHDGTVIY